MTKLMVAEEPWHYRKVTYWDMPKCATCGHWDKEYPAPDKMCGHDEVSQVTAEFFGCVFHTDIPQPETIPTPSDKAE